VSPSTLARQFTARWSDVAEHAGTLQSVVGTARLSESGYVSAKIAQQSSSSV
jgi:hypothetical protein